MKKIIALMLFSTILFVGCVNDSVNIKEDFPSPTLDPTATAILYKTDSPDKTPVATPTPSPYYSYPNPFYDQDAWQNLTNYRFNSVSGVDEKKREDF